jgi:hypothetical protein
MTTLEAKRQRRLDRLAKGVKNIHWPNPFHKQVKFYSTPVSGNVVAIKQSLWTRLVAYLNGFWKMLLRTKKVSH